MRSIQIGYSCIHSFEHVRSTSEISLLKYVVFSLLLCITLHWIALRCVFCVCHIKCTSLIQRELKSNLFYGMFCELPMPICSMFYFEFVFLRFCLRFLIKFPIPAEHNAVQSQRHSSQWNIQTKFPYTTNIIA